MNESSLEGREAAGECLVMKFGGTSVQDAAAIRRVCQLVRRVSSQHPVLVVSALAKVTDQLMDAGWAAAKSRFDPASAILQPVRQRHETVAAGLVAGDDCVRLREKFAQDFEAHGESVEHHRVGKGICASCAGSASGIGRDSLLTARARGSAGQRG